MDKLTAIRDVVYGFIELDEQEREIISHKFFQRLRRIKQLAFTDMVYPGATHTRFEHSLGVMQMATDMFDAIVKNSEDILLQYYKLKTAGLERLRKVIRLAALLHDVGHAPFSHAGEGLFPENTNSDRHYEHEDYSVEIIKTEFQEIICKHPTNNNYNITVDDVIALLISEEEGKLSIPPKNSHIILFKDIVSGAIDADRADYLLRDSYHSGVKYGYYDKDRLVQCMKIVKDKETDDPLIAIDYKGWHTAESLILARYYMFTQVYFHKVRRIYDYHLSEALKSILNKIGNDGFFPPPNKLDEYYKFDDWFIYSQLLSGHGGSHGAKIINREHYKCVDEEKYLQQTNDEIGHWQDTKMKTTWYKTKKEVQIFIAPDLKPLSELSPTMKSLNDISMEDKFYIEHVEENDKS